MQRFLKISFLLLALVLVAQVAFCQVVPPAPNPNDGAPIDGMSSVLLGLGFGYGAVKMRLNKAK
jgi:hypothetical protein